MNITVTDKVPEELIQKMSKGERVTL